MNSTPFDDEYHPRPTSPTSVFSIPESMAPIHEEPYPNLQDLLPGDRSTNVTLLTCESTAANVGLCKVFLFGTDHISQDSCVQVKELIRFLKPEVVFLESCRDRLTILTPHRGNLMVPTIREIILRLKEGNNIYEIVYLCFLGMTSEGLEFVPGSEFRVADEQATKYGAKVILGDRNIQIVLRLTWLKMPLWHKTKFLFSLLFGSVFLPGHEGMNKMLKETDDNDIVTFLIQEMSKAFPTLAETLVLKRDQYMASKLLKVARKSNSVVAIVGKGHVQGIKKHWGLTLEESDLSTPSTPRPISKSIVISIVFFYVGATIISGIYLPSKN